MSLARRLPYYRSNLFMYIKTKETKYLTETAQARNLAKLTPEGRAELAEFNRRFYKAQIDEPRQRLARKDIPASDYDLFPEEWLIEIGVIDEDYDWDEHYKESE